MGIPFVCIPAVLADDTLNGADHISSTLGICTNCPTLTDVNNLLLLFPARVILTDAFSSRVILHSRILLSRNTTFCSIAILGSAGILPGRICHSRNTIFFSIAVILGSTLIFLLLGCSGFFEF